MKLNAETVLQWSTLALGFRVKHACSPHVSSHSLINQVRLTGDFEFPIGVNVSVSACLSQ